MLKAPEGAGLQANPQGGWSRLDRIGPEKWEDDHSDSQEAADEHKGEPATEGCSPECAQRAKDRITELIARGCENQPSKWFKELDSWFIALARQIGTSEAISTTVSICEGNLKNDTVLELLCHNRHPVTVQLSQREVVSVWPKSIGDINPGSKNLEARKAKGAEGPTARTA